MKTYNIVNLSNDVLVTFSASYVDAEEILDRFNGSQNWTTTYELEEVI